MNNIYVVRYKKSHSLHLCILGNKNAGNRERVIWLSRGNVQSYLTTLEEDHIISASQFSIRSANTWLLVLSESSLSDTIHIARVKAQSFPYCPQCGTWNPPTAQFCMHCGTPLDSPSANHRQPWINRSSGSPYQGVAIRFVALFIDTLIITLVSFSPVFAGAVPLIFSATTSELSRPLVFWVLLVLNMVVTFAYFTLLEGRYGQTIGKKAVHIKVVRTGNWRREGEGAPISYSQAVQRTILRLLDRQPCYLVGALLIW